uniref:Uncharacterized protein n=1 Tax=Anopheles quadriannulatus TaxID=34691 RepID=A0A182XS12_ANOQN
MKRRKKNSFAARREEKTK